MIVPHVGACGMVNLYFGLDKIYPPNTQESLILDAAKVFRRCMNWTLQTVPGSIVVIGGVFPSGNCFATLAKVARNRP